MSARGCTRSKHLVKKAAFLLYNIIVVHPFVNGNKRTAYELVKLFLRLNGYQIGSDSSEDYQFLIDVASGRVSAADVERWVTMNLTELNEEQDYGPKAESPERVQGQRV
jgi:death on curing protein